MNRLIETTMRLFDRLTGKFSLSQSTDRDVTSLVKNLGIPFKKGAYARNVWDMQLFNQKIYMGHGNSCNSGPDPNAGPIPIVCYDPFAGSFSTPFTVDEEQINIFRIMDGKLYIPGHDPRDSWAYGNFYRLGENGWEKIRTIPNGVHNFDMALFKGKLYAALSAENVVMFSEDMGTSWKPLQITEGKPFTPYKEIATNLFEFRGSLYSAGHTLSFTPGLNSQFNMVLVTDGVKTSVADLLVDRMFPGAPKYDVYTMARMVPVKNSLVYVGARVINGIQWTPVGLFIASGLNQAKRMNLPERQALPTDILVRGQEVYILAYLKVSQTSYTNIVYKSTTMATWTEVLRYNFDTFARSFEELNGDFYFGSGTHEDYVSPSAGTILKVPKESYS